MQDTSCVEQGQTSGYTVERGAVRLTNVNLHVLQMLECGPRQDGVDIPPSALVENRPQQIRPESCVDGNFMYGVLGRHLR